MPDPVTFPPSPPLPLFDEASEPAPPALVDAWPGSAPFRLTGFFERGRFHPILAAFLVFTGAFIVFNLIGGVILAVPLAMDIVSGSGEVPVDNAQLLAENGGLLLVGNSVGQFVGFALLAFWAAWLSTRDVGPFLRLRAPDAAGLALASAGWVALVPVVQWLGAINASLPIPEALRGMDEMRADLIEGFLMHSGLPTWALFLGLAVTPAICEELLFRGYLQRQVERRLGAAWTIVLVGVFFGLYHLTATQLLPLAALGVYLCFVVWATGDLWSGVLVHLLNNGLAVLASAYVRSQPDLDLESIEAMETPWYFVASGIVGTAVLCRVLWSRRQALTGGRPDAMPAAPAPRGAPSLTPLPTP